MSYYRDGRYRAKITGQYFGESTAKGTPFFALKINVEAYYEPSIGDYVSPGECYERTVTLYLTEKTMEFVTPKLRSLGFEGASFREIDPDTPNFHSFENTHADFICTIETKDGKSYEKWDFPPTEKPPEASVPGLSRKLDALFSTQLKVGAKPKAAKPAPAAKPVRQTVPGNAGGDDEVPF